MSRMKSRVLKRLATLVELILLRERLILQLILLLLTHKMRWLLRISSWDKRGMLQI